jgi:hypothetical protein
MKTESQAREVQSFTSTFRLLQMLVLSLLGLLAAPSASAVGNVVISQVFGGGGGSGYYKYDYVELYNRTDMAVPLSGWSIQYGSSSGNVGSSSSLVYAIPAGTLIQPGAYLLIQIGSAGTTGIGYPVPPDLISTSGTMNLSATAGKVALANTTTPLNVPGPSGSGIIDFVGYGSANQGEGGTKANNGVNLNNMQGCIRKMVGFKDTDDNNLDFDVVTAPVPRNSKVGKPRFFAGNWLPPTNGMYVSPAMWHQAYANGYIISNVAHRIFTGSVLPPPPGGPVSHTFNSTLEFQISIDSGSTWQAVSVPGVTTTVSVSSNSTVGGYAVYTNAMTTLSFPITGGTLPSGIQIRLNTGTGTNSTGQARVQSIPGGYMVSSFFDIFTQISTDGGGTWQSASNGPVHMELKPDPALIASVGAPRSVLPMPNGQYVSPAMWHQLYQSGIVIKDLKHKLFAQWMEPPVFGYTNTHTFDSQLDFQLSQDGGVTFTAARAPATMTVKISNVRGFQNQSTYDTEVTQLDVSGGDLPGNVHLRVSPNTATTGGTSMVAGGGGGGTLGGAAISSFFDIFTEVSTDGGNSYYPATNGPAHMELQRVGSATLFTDNLLPSLAGEYISPQQWHAYYANGIIITNVFHRYFTAAITPPSPGGSLSHTFGSTVEFDLSQDGGLSYTHVSAPATVGVHVTARTGDDGTTVYYDTEMTQLDISGGSLPPEVQIHASPTKVSTGRTTSSAVSGGNGGYQIDSFFDIFLEVSLDGGMTWQPSTAGPATVTLKPGGTQTATLNITCPTNMIVTATNPAGAKVYYAPLVSGTCPPFTTNCAPPSGSTFPIGNTVVTCTANDSCGNVTNCTFTITVVPRPLSITCPSNITVRATSSAGAVVTYTVTASGGCPPITVSGAPASGSTFPIGTTTVNCTATDACGQQANCTFNITVLRQLQKRFYQQNLLPPTSGMFVPPAPGVLAFPGGIIISNITHRVFSAGAVPPPSVGANVTHSFNSQVEMDISFDGGLSWESCVVSNAPSQAYAVNNGLDSADTVYGGQMLQLNASGGTLPAGVMIRESPTLASAGETRIEPTPGGYMIDSFFDIFLEVSTDSGGSWIPASGPLRLELKPDPQLIAAAPAPRKVLPMPNGQYISPTAWHQLYASGIVIKDIRHKLFTGWMEPPVFSGSQTHTFDSQLDFQLSTDGGSHFMAARAPATMTVTIQNNRVFQARSTYETEVSQLDAAGGDLPVGVMIRESPTKASKGGTSSMAGGGGGGAGGGAAISSFFDIFTEVSTDSGGTWGAATNGPAHMELQRIAAVHTYTNNLLPVLTGEYVSPQQWHAYYAVGIVITNVIHRSFTAAITPPLPGNSTSHTFGSTLEFDVSYDGGLTYSHTTAPATVGVQITCRLGDDGVTEYYDTEMTQLSIAGGGLPSNVQIRESPTKASLGRTTSSSASGNYQTDSFFDIFTEVSTDGGISWYPSVAGPATVTLQPRSPQTALNITCPSNMVVTTSNAAGAVVDYTVLVSGGCPPYTTNCVPPSGSTFALGTTTVNCTVTDVCGGQASCSFTVTVLPLALGITCPSNITVPATSKNGAVVTYPAPTITGGCPPITVTCVPPSGGTFPIGTTTVNCTATDACGQQANCTFTVTVLPPPALVITCPSKITVPATSPAGAVVTYTVTTSGGCPPITVTCVPPSGSTFPIGTTTVTCTATDACGQQATCTFTVTVLRLLNKSFYPQNLLPPTNGLFVPPTPLPITFPGGIIVSNIGHGSFSTGVVPPLTTGGSLTKSFTSQVQVDISLDYGATWHSCVVSNVPVTVGITNLGPDGDDVLYGTELTELNISGGTLPSGVVIRESPTLASLGQTRIQPDTGGYQIDSFFDIFLEVSTDFGGVYVPATSACTVEVKPDPALVAATPLPRPVLPAPNGQYVGPWQGYGNGVIVREIRHKLFTYWNVPPGFGGTQTHTFDSQLDFQLSTDGGATFTAARAPATVTVTISNVRGFQGRSTYDTEMTQLDVQGGDLPALMRIRESPTKASKGGTSSLAGGGGGGVGGGAAISSFFDVFTEVSTDGGLVYYPATNGPCHMELQRIATAYPFTNNILPNPLGEYLSRQHAIYGTSYVLTNVFHRGFTTGFTPPPPGFTDIHTFGSTVEFDLSQDGGHAYSHASAPATVTVQITARTGDDGVTVYYDTEMTQLDIYGGGLPSNVQIRESPTKQSLGRTTSSGSSGGGGGGGAGYQIDSFFDVYTEITTDGGGVWVPTTSGSAEVTLEPVSPQTALDITCPTNMTVMTTDPAGAVVDYTVLVSGGCPPYTTNCVPPSGSMFPIGTTMVNCTVTDVCGGQASCSFTVTVVPLPLGITCPSNITVRATSPAGAVVNYAVTTSGGCPPITLTCVPPSGTTFPIGTTTVVCTATDACGQQATCSFTVTVLPLLNKSFYQQNLLPPTNGLFVPPTPVPIIFPGGIIVSNIGHGSFSTGVVPPLTPGGSLTKSFTSQVQVDISLNYGETWQSCVVSNVPVTVGITNLGSDGEDILYGTELTQLDISGGTLPSLVRIRESPTLASTGQTHIQPDTGGYQIDSFFDIFLEASTDGGLTYQPANSACTVQVKPDPALVAATPLPRPVLPAPNGQYVGPWQVYGNGVMVKEIRHKLFTYWNVPPGFGGTQTHTFDSQLDFQLSTDGGVTFTAARAPATVTVTISNVRGFQGRSTYDTEMIQLDVHGGDLPLGMMIRESPTKASKGGTSSLAGGGGGGAGGGAAISSFFDVFTEVSTDSGLVWWTATNGPCRMELRRISLPYVFTNNLLPNVFGEYLSRQHAIYGSGYVLTNVVHRGFAYGFTPPPEGFSDTHTFGSTVEFDLSQNGGVTYSHASAPATVTVQITGRLGGDGVTEYYDTEMTQLDISGGGLPSTVHIRESPTKASLGRTTSTGGGGGGGAGGYQIDSFFDVFTEISTDGGISWLPTITGPAEVTLQPVPVPALITRIARITGGYSIIYTNGSGADFVLLNSPTVRAPMTNWTPVATNTTGFGSFTVSPTTGTYYRIQSR